MRFPLYGLAMLLLPCLSSAGLAGERWQRHERHGAGQPTVRHEAQRHRHDAHRHRHHHHHKPHPGLPIIYPWYVPPQPVVLLPPMPPPGAYWYFCANPLGYHPYVGVCAVEWQKVVPGFGAPYS